MIKPKIVILSKTQAHNNLSITLLILNMHAQIILPAILINQALIGGIVGIEDVILG